MSTHLVLVHTIISIWSIQANNVPIIGILTMPCWVEYELCPWTVDPFSIQFFPASYVKWIEAGGAKVIPIMSDAKHEEVRHLLSIVNGIVFPGGAAFLYGPSEYWYQIHNILKYLREWHDDNPGQAIPIWSTCMGFEAMVCATSQAGYSAMGLNYSAINIPLPIEWYPYANESELFSPSYTKLPTEYSQSVMDKIAKENITMNSHSGAFDADIFNTDPYLASNFSVLGISYDRWNQPFVALIESKKELGLKWFGAQFHPEKPSFEFNAVQDTNIPHSIDATYVNQYFVEFFVEQCRESNNITMPQNEYNKRIIYNYQAYYLDKNNTCDYEQVYMFKRNDE
eukprot:282646_1